MQATNYWLGFNHPIRQQIIQLLKDNPLTTGHICQQFTVSRFAVMKHLRVLEQAGFVYTEKRGRERWYFLNAEQLAQPPIPSLDMQVSIQHTEWYATAPSVVFSALTNSINAWWTFREPDGGQVVLEAEVNGRFYQPFSTPNSGLLYGTVIYIKPDEEIRLMGPLDFVDDLIINKIRWQVCAEDGGTRLTVFHRMAGEATNAHYEQYKRRWHELFGIELRQFLQVTS